MILSFVILARPAFHKGWTKVILMFSPAESTNSYVLQMLQIQDQFQGEPN